MTSNDVCSVLDGGGYDRRRVSLLKRMHVNRTDAVAAGAKYFFTGHACKRGHLTKRLASSGDCAECMAARSKRWAEENSEQERVRKRAQYFTNRDAVLARSKHFAVQNPDKVRKYKSKHAASLKAKERRAKWVAQNRESIRLYLAQYNRDNADRLKEQKRAYQKSNPDVCRTSNRNRRARVVSAEGSHTTKDVRLINKRQGFRCVYCGTATFEEYHVDHIVALARGGSNYPDNLQITCPRCNRRKHTASHAAFLERMGAWAYEAEVRS